MPRRAVRTDFATYPPEILDIFRRFAATGGPIEFTFPTKRQANNLRGKLYNARLMMTRAVAEGDPIAEELYPSAQYLYTELDPPAEGGGTTDGWILRIMTDPIVRATYGPGVLPWRTAPQEEEDWQ